MISTHLQKESCYATIFPQSRDKLKVGGHPSLNQVDYDIPMEIKGLIQPTITSQHFKGH
jgi:hypothetical protein